MSFGKALAPLSIFFVIISLALLVAPAFWDANKIDPLVVAVANLILWSLAAFSLRMHTAPINKPSGFAVMKGITLAFLLKFFVIAVTVVCYLVFTTKAARSFRALAVAGVVYIVYSYLEVRIATEYNKKQNAHK